ncbi:E3 ubiquitin-protein ligase RNF213-like [Anoplopoma fimbria]|uniref:E3 ubiquitin-protein ligase RNF213-like n=1 Tax=Anoplopoma fimbria TaxID=229290 RepID=UPI0023EC614F|nr:E3 ubiquitin-protein ligase RNF213-like [Anoplopoma fimbria]
MPLWLYGGPGVAPLQLGQPASDDQEAGRDGATPQDPSDNTASTAAGEKRAKHSSHNQTLSAGETVTTRKTEVAETCKEDERPSATAPESDFQPCSVVAPGSNLSDYTTPPSSTPASDKLTEQQTAATPDISTEGRLDAVQIPADQQKSINSGLFSNSVSSQALTRETGSTALESSEKTPQECDRLAKQSVSENIIVFVKGQPASDDQEAGRDGATPQDPSDNTASTAAGEKRAKHSSHNQTLSAGETVTTRKTEVAETCKEDERPSATAPESDFQPCSEVAPGSNLSDYTTPPSSTPASDKLNEQQTAATPDISTEGRLDAVQIPADQQKSINSGLFSNSVSSQALTRETGSTALESSEQTPQECDRLAKQSVSESSVKKESARNTKGQPASDDQEAGRDGATPQDPSDNTASTAAGEKRAKHSSHNQTLSAGETVTTRKTEVAETCKEDERPSATAPESDFQPCSVVAPGSNLSDYTTPPSSTPASDKLTEQQTAATPDISTEGRLDAVQIPADQQQSINSGLLSISVSSQALTRETRSTAPESSEKKPQECDRVAKQSVSEQDKDKTVFNETQNLSGRPDGKAVNTRSKEKTNKRMAEIQTQQPGNRDVDVSSSPTPCSPLSQNILETSTEVQAPQTLPSSDYMPVYFHAVTSKDCHLDPEKDFVFLRSERIFGGWDNPGLKMFFSRSLGNKSYLVEGRVMIPRNLIHKSIPYKYVICKHSENEHKYETIYQKDENQLVNRCLTIKEDFLTHEGEWHQYDDVIHLELKKKFGFWNSSIEEVVLKGRELAGEVMLTIPYFMMAEKDRGDYHTIVKR